MNDDYFMTDWCDDNNISDWWAESLSMTDWLTYWQIHWLATETNHLTDRLKHDSLSNWPAFYSLSNIHKKVKNWFCLQGKWLTDLDNLI